jgi:hypothetical protein
MVVDAGGGTVVMLSEATSRWGDPLTEYTRI